MMATGKSIADAARKLEEGCVVTAMTRNGRNFGIRISGMGDQWFTAPVNTPKGLYFTGFCEEDGNPGYRRQRHHRDSWRGRYVHDRGSGCYPFCRCRRI